jgi:hypothetical protein
MGPRIFNRKVKEVEKGKKGENEGRRREFTTDSL